MMLIKHLNDKTKIVSAKKSFEEQHKNCISCHTKNENCNNCHNQKVTEQFDHGKKTGWALNKFHIKLKCAACHGNSTSLQKTK